MSGAVQPLRGAVILQLHHKGGQNFIFKPSWVEKKNTQVIDLMWRAVLSKD